MDLLKKFDCTLTRFALVGASGIIVNEGVLIVLVELFKQDLFLSSISAIELSIISNFLLNNAWTFKNDGNRTFLSKFTLFQGISVFGALINLGVLALLVSVGIDYRIANVAGIGVAFISNYLLNKKVTWSD
jgi:dolichol-phosphate mannosyltransferase